MQSNIIFHKIFVEIFEMENENATDLQIENVNRSFSFGLLVIVWREVIP